MDEIRIYGLECFAHHGVYEEEKRGGQPFVINATLFVDVRKAGETDEMTDSTHYGEVCQFMNDWMQQHTCNLLEAVASKMAQELLRTFPLVKSVALEIQKPEAPIPLPFETVSVCIERGWHQVYLGVGSNMGDKNGFISQAVKTLEADPGIRFVKCSKLLVTKPYGGVEQEDFVNGAISLETYYSPNQLLDLLHDIEKEAGRERLIHWGPRTLDLDILFYDREIVEQKDLCIPHVDMANRYFVLKPLSELCPYFHHPVTGLTVLEMLSKVSDDEAQAN